MRHNQSVLMALSREPNDTVFQKTLALSDFYFGADDWDYPLGLIQMCAASRTASRSAARRCRTGCDWLPEMPFEEMAAPLDRFLADERGPAAAGEPHLLRRTTASCSTSHESNMEATSGCEHKLRATADAGGAHPHLLERTLYLGKDIPIGGTAHQAGTLRFGTDPASSVLDLDCKAHELDNLYVTDASFFPSIGAVNPTLTIIANALRVADHLQERLGA